MKKFGAQTENSKKDLRAQRFGVASPATATGGAADPSVLEKRAQRFGGVATNTAPTSVDKEALEKRAKRFGVAANGNSEESKVFLNDLINFLIN